MANSQVMQSEIPVPAFEWVKDEFDERVFVNEGVAANWAIRCTKAAGQPQRWLYRRPSGSRWEPLARIEQVGAMKPVVKRALEEIQQTHPQFVNLRVQEVEPEEPAKVPALSDMVEVIQQLELAKESAEVGDDIRWDVVMELAAGMPCGLKQMAPKNFKTVDDGEVSTAPTTASSGECSSEDTSCIAASSCSEAEPIVTKQRSAPKTRATSGTTAKAKNVPSVGGVMMVLEMLRCQRRAPAVPEEVETAAPRTMKPRKAPAETRQPLARPKKVPAAMVAPPPGLENAAGKFSPPPGLAPPPGLVAPPPGLAASQQRLAPTSKLAKVAPPPGLEAFGPAVC